MKRKIIDVSQWQGWIDWDLVKRSGVDGAIIRCGYGNDMATQDDWHFHRNTDECERLGIPYGVYIYSYAADTEMAKSEAAHVLRLVKGKKLSYPIYIDLEENNSKGFAKQAANVFGDEIEKSGYWCGVYASLSWWENYLKGLERFTKWVAHWDVDKPGIDCDMWQYSSNGRVSGINGRVDMNYCYRDFTKLIKHKKTLDDIAKEVIRGEWGNGKERRKKLEKAGYDYKTVQARVNEIL